MSKGFKFMIIADLKLYLTKKQKFFFFFFKKRLIIKFDNFSMNYI